MSRPRFGFNEPMTPSVMAVMLAVPSLLQCCHSFLFQGIMNSRWALAATVLLPRLQQTLLVVGAQDLDAGKADALRAAMDAPPAQETAGGADAPPEAQPAAEAAADPAQKPRRAHKRAAPASAPHDDAAEGAGLGLSGAGDMTDPADADPAADAILEPSGQAGGAERAGAADAALAAAAGGAAEGIEGGGDSDGDSVLPRIHSQVCLLHLHHVI